VLEVVCDERQPQLQRMRRNHRVERADRRSLRNQHGGHLAEAIGSRLIEGNDGNIADEGVDQAVQATGTSPFGTEAKLRQRDGAQAQLRRQVVPDLLGDTPSPRSA